MAGMEMYRASFVWPHLGGENSERLDCQPEVPIINLAFPESRLEALVGHLGASKNLRVSSIGYDEIYLNYVDLDGKDDQMSLLEVFVDGRRSFEPFGVYGNDVLEKSEAKDLIYRCEKRGFYVFVTTLPIRYQSRHRFAVRAHAVMKGYVISCDHSELRPFPYHVSDYGIVDEILPCYDNAQMQRRQELREIERLAREMSQGKSFEIQERYYPRPG